ncbi:DUF3299 domain-containing protein [Roseateles chitosanitabidus]|uniref:DUF3299 domain-containing protein n=1 Tax=Roseateles chitosanitabidus TaxID=65048 RepID=UPI000AEF2A9B|nr:DUF3299 domain-containing protein [Roseateles chitosanitabidus]
MPCSDPIIVDSTTAARRRRPRGRIAARATTVIAAIATFNVAAALTAITALVMTPTLAAAAAPGTTAPSAPAASTPATGYRELTWLQLVPPGWDPMKRFRDLNLGRLSDSSPRTASLMADLRDELDNAPLVESLQDAPVRLPGYVVPLQADRDGVREFLLVPYFGACIHMPPPPANQIVLVRLAQPARQLRAMDTVWASGVLKLDRQPSEMGVSGYRLEAGRVEAYRSPPR